MQTNAVIVYLNLSIETSFPCIPTTEKVREEVGAYSRRGGEALFWHYEIGGRHLFGEGHSLERRRLVEEIRYSLIVPFSEQTSSYLKYLMNSCILHSEPSILRLLHSIVTLLIPQILHSYEFEFEILILVVVSYCGVSNVVSWRPLFLIPIQILFCLLFICFSFI